MIQERIRKCASGYVALLILPILSILLFWWFVRMAASENTTGIITSIVLFSVVLIGYKGFFMVAPNQSKVLQLFGTYVGSVHETGLRWANPFYSKETVSLRVRNFESEMLKVNDSSGNPIEIAAVVVWKVVDSAEAVFEVDDYVNYVHIQSEAALRNMTTAHRYEVHDDVDELSLRGDPQAIADKLKAEVQERLGKAGVEAIEARISHLAYAPEIASAMLKRQQAQAVVSARRQIVDGAVGMVKMALEQLDEENIVELDEERKAAMVSNLLVVLCGEENARPVVNAGSIHG